MNKYQKAYIIAKANFELIAEKAADTIEALNIQEKNDDNYKVIREQYETIRAFFGFGDALVEMQRAEDNLLEWAHKSISRMAIAKPHAATLNEVYANRFQQKIKMTLVELALRYTGR